MIMISAENCYALEVLNLIHIYKNYVFFSLRFAFPRSFFSSFSPLNHTMIIENIINIKGVDLIKVWSSAAHAENLH